MIELAILALINVFVIVGFYKSTEFTLKDKNASITKDTKVSDIDDKMLLWFVRFYAIKHLGRLSKPITTCIFCMASLHSLYVYFSFYDFNMSTPIDSSMKFIVYVFAVCGGVTFINEKY